MGIRHPDKNVNFAGLNHFILNVHEVKLIFKRYISVFIYGKCLKHMTLL